MSMPDVLYIGRGKHVIYTRWRDKPTPADELMPNESEHAYYSRGAVERELAKAYMLGALDGRGVNPNDY